MDPKRMDETMGFIQKTVGTFATIPFDWEPWETNLKLSHWRDLNVVVSYTGPKLTREARQWFDSVIDFGEMLDGR
jgi:hypothetical protein